ncbi:response regulator transcription factor [Kineococcus sp. SYSU DK006]|uniref:response regulator transcription factor n=1 Tax=Kineococcus sp. SYSU DK006 TaxID=3383127 RepID=UPI003D7D68B6
MGWAEASRAAGRIAAACSATGPARTRAEHALAELHALVPYTGASLARWNGTRHVLVAQAGYQAQTLADLNGPVYLRDPMWHVTSARRVPTRWQDLPFPAERSPLYRESLRPHGYREGMTAPFFRPDGGYAGMLTLNTDSAAHPDDPAVEVLRLVSPRWTTVLAGSGDEPPADPEHQPLRIAVSNAGDCTALRAAQVPDELLEAARRLRDRAGGFAWVPGHRLPWRLRGEPSSSPGIASVVRCEPAPVPGGLSRREVEVLTGLASGASNEEIARDLHASRRTVSTHVEHVLAKLGVRSRTEAAVLALREGVLALL